VLGGTGCSAGPDSGGCRDFLVVSNARSSLAVEAESGRAVTPDSVADEDRVAFDRVLASIQIEKRSASGIILNAPYERGVS